MKTIDAYVVLADGKLDLQKVYTEEFVAAKDARIAELESENSHLRHGMTGDYDLDAWLEWCAQKDATPSEDGPECKGANCRTLTGDHSPECVLEAYITFGCDQETLHAAARDVFAQHSRIVAAKDAEIARWKEQFVCMQLQRNHHRERANTAQPARQVGGDELRIVFDGPPGPECGRFVEVENERGESVNAGEWRVRPDGLWELVILRAALAPAAVVMPDLSALSEVLRLAPTKECQDENSVWRRAARTLDEVARLNRNAIPVELIKRALYHIELSYGDMPTTRELRALLGNY